VAGHGFVPQSGWRRNLQPGLELGSLAHPGCQLHAGVFEGALADVRFHTFATHVGFEHGFVVPTAHTQVGVAFRSHVVRDGATIFGTGNLTAWDSGASFQVSVNALGVEEMSVQDPISPPAGPQLVSGVGDIGGFTHLDLATPSVMSINPEIGTTTSLDYAALTPSFMVRVGNGNRGGQNIGVSSEWWHDLVACEYGAVGCKRRYRGGGRRRQPGVVQSFGTRVFFTTDKGSTWTASTAVPAGVWIGADRVNPLEFYAFANWVFCISSDGAATFLASPAANLPPTGTSGYFRAVPGRAGDLWLAGGSTTSVVYGLWHSTDGGQSFRKLPQLDGADNIGFGMPAPHQKYLALYTSAQVHGVGGIYRSVDGGAQLDAH
jgi:xyloglucan-specific exo-beta-1,4-glucanase